MKLHTDAFDVTPELVRSLLRASAASAAWADLPLRPAGHGTDNVMMRLGDEHVVRLPQRPSSAAAIRKEAQWLPRISSVVPLAVPYVRLMGEPTAAFPAPWAVYGWIEGDHPSDVTVADWAAFGQSLARFVSSLHSIDVSDDDASDGMSWYRGRLLAEFEDEAVDVIGEEIAPLVRREGLDLDLGRLVKVWRRLAATPQVFRDPVLLHGDLRAANLLVDSGHLAAVIDFGTLSIGQPAAEHGPIWNFPRPARDAYRDALGLTDDDWALSLGWTLLPALTGLPYYWDSWPEFAQECLDRIRLVMDEVG